MRTTAVRRSGVGEALELLLAASDAGSSDADSSDADSSDADSSDADSSDDGAPARTRRRCPPHLGAGRR
ncbi:hypothetical protein I4I73_11815 [Pseudonocardia sp. KRD-184]|uniref:Uncharacterized protein n=1 Tax=Pseudonocardia oceani TaxID=2792013 RepID=A0ABS6UIB1_9PSEU|nr:hypothetical protein [Pseudonocardia oceani]MBW0090865.1 hypothetical protein [Pseudonocardia oceani]MBW0096673.1 hypothetical protein [Pseudonocardia oceani]MBW0110533.1 hypothetical protein [Pseudonocardia oceani]MBW0122107.1 hypothetical protein [Pseudonocardia oceani]MBW0131991.1 hypothetical protein [Pseudonocardia oceani]